MTNGSMTKAELVEEVSRVSDLTKKHSEVIVDTVFRSIIEALHRGEKIERRVGRHGLQGLAVASNLAHAVLPGLSGWRGRRLRPIVIRPAPFTVRGVSAKLEDVALGEPNVFEELPRRIRQTGWLLAAQRFGDVLDRAIEPDVCVFPVEQPCEVLTEPLVVRHGLSSMPASRAPRVPPRPPAAAPAPDPSAVPGSAGTRGSPPWCHL